MNGQCAIVSYSEIQRDELGFGEVSDDMHPQPHLLIPLLGCSSPPLSDPLQVLDRDVAPHPTVSLSFLLLRMLFPPTPPRQLTLTHPQTPLLACPWNIISGPLSSTHASASQQRRLHRAPVPPAASHVPLHWGCWGPGFLFTTVTVLITMLVASFLSVLAALSTILDTWKE